eukprot:1147420-Pelagomonas_calceolata.AAC.3
MGIRVQSNFGDIAAQLVERKSTLRSVCTRFLLRIQLAPWGSKLVAGVPVDVLFLCVQQLLLCVRCTRSACSLAHMMSWRQQAVLKQQHALHTNTWSAILEMDVVEIMLMRRRAAVEAKDQISKRKRPIAVSTCCFLYTKFYELVTDLPENPGLIPPGTELQEVKTSLHWYGCILLSPGRLGVPLQAN